MIKVQNANANKIFKWFASSTDVFKGQLIKSASGAAPVAAAHTGTTLLGVAMEDQTTTNGVVYLYPLTGTILEIDVLQTGTKKTFAVTDLGSQYDIVVASDATASMSLDPDDTTGGFLILVDYDNDNHKAYCVVEAADILLSI